MLSSLFRPYIQRREEVEAQEDDHNKSVAPLDLGLNCLGLADSSRDNLETLITYVDSKLRDSQAFFTHEPELRYKIEGAGLSFPSNIETETQENNRVYCTIETSARAGRAVILIGHWNSSRDNYATLARVLSLLGITCIHISMPYHDERMSSEMAIADYMVSANLGRTIRSFRQAVLDTRLAIDWAKNQGYEKIGLIGASVGSCVASITAAHDNRIDSLALLLMAGDFAEVVWTGRATRHIREGIEPDMDLQTLDCIWRILSPISYTEKLRENTNKVMVISGKEDRVFEPYLTKRQIREYERLNVDFRWHDLSSGHYTLSMFPFNILVVLKLRQFFST